MSSLLLVSILLFAVTMSAILPSVVVRPNVGTVFLKDRDVTLSPVVWHHTVAVPFFPGATRHRQTHNNSAVGRCE